MSDDTVRVAVRIRPLVKSELDKGCKNCINITPGEPQVVIKDTDKAFTFNYVFPPDISQKEFYDTAIKDMINHIFEGYNVTILAYGQTGAGKTHSMGTDYNGKEDMGVIPRAMNDIFEIINSKEEWNFKTTVSFIELYQEQLYDLLSNNYCRSESTVDIREDGKSIKVVGVTEKEVISAEESLKCLIQGSQGRATGATAMNLQSSRSHAIFTLTIQQQKKDDPNSATMAKFHLVDLAGSERIKKTQATGERFKEGVNINKGLLALGNVISQLGEGGPGSYVGYRDSKLTRLLQDSLGGNSMTLMIACVSPADYNLDETLSTLRYADRARKIKNKPIINQDPKVAEINRLNKLVQELKLALMGQQISSSCNECQELQTKNEMLHQKIRDLTEKLNENLIKIVFMHEKSELAEQVQERIKADLLLLSEDCKLLLESFVNDPENLNEHQMKLKEIYTKILELQTTEKEVRETVANREMLQSDSTISRKSNEDNETNIEISTCLEDFDEKHEEHTMLQAKRHDEVENINKQLAVKELLMSELLKNSSQVVDDHSKELQEMEQEIKTLQTERDELLVALRNAQSNNIGSKLAESRRKKVQELEKKIADLNRKCLEQSKIIKAKEKSQQQIKNLTNEIQSLKQARVKLIRQMRSDADKFSEWKRLTEKEFNKLRDQDRKRLNQMARLQLQHSKQQNVFKRKMEEISAVNKRLKEALEMQRKASQRREKTSSSKDDIQSWIAQELEMLTSTINAEHSLQKLLAERSYLACQMERLKNESSPNEAEVAEFSEFLQVRNTQIAELQQKIIQADKANKAKTRLNSIQTMADAKAALKIFFEVAAEDKKEQFYYEEKIASLQAQLEEFQKRENELKEELDNFRNSQVKRKVLTEKNSNGDFKTPMKLKRTAKSHSPGDMFDENSYILSSEDSFVEEDDTNDPDWCATPLYNRIQKLLSTTKSTNQSYKRTSDSEIKCACKSKCRTRLCMCRKNGQICHNCMCNPELCENKDKEKVTRSFFLDRLDEKTEKRENTENVKKKPRLNETQVVPPN